MQRHLRKHWWIAVLAGVVAGVLILPQFNWSHSGAAGQGGANKANAAADPRQPATRVTVIKPQTGGIQRTSNQPGTIEAFDFADLYAKVSGYLKKQPVDIGQTIKAGEVLAEIDAPELQQELNHAEAALVQARAQVAQTEARVATAKADFAAATANIKLSDADLAKATAYLSFREKQYQRTKSLFEKDSIEERLVDEKLEQREAALAAENSARAGILSAKALAAAAEAKIAQADADVLDARAKVQLAQATVAKARVFVDYLNIVSPYDGVVTRRSFHVGDFIRAAEQGGNMPLLTVARTDLMRVVVQVPERDVPFTNPGDLADIELDAVHGRKFRGKVSRIAHAEDRVTRSMRTEIDLENSSDLLRDGMFLRVTIYLDKTNKGLTVPSTALVGDAKSKRFSVFVVRGGKAHLQRVEIGTDDGIRVEIASGISSADLVVLRPGSDLTEGTPVETELSEEPKARSSGGREE